MKIINSFFPLLLITFLTGSCKSSCRFVEIKTIYAGYLSNGGIVSYGHVVLLRDFSKQCIDSALIVNIAHKYMDTVKQGLPVGVISFFSTDSDFRPGEVSYDSSIGENCLVKIAFDLKTKHPDIFWFFDNSGNIIYTGERWQTKDKLNK